MKMSCETADMAIQNGKLAIETFFENDDCSG